MIYYIISDIHANYEALKTCLADLDRDVEHEVICLGDVVGYGPEPNECVDAIRDLCKIVIMGNHDQSAINDESLEYFNQYAREAMLWTRKTLTDENRDYLRGLVMNSTKESMHLVHATPHNPEEWNYIFYLGDAELNFRAFDEQICFVGHSHQPVILEKTADGKIFINRELKTEIRDGHQYIINVGSVGQPRDQDTRLAYGIYDTDKKTVEIRRLYYPIEKTQEKMRDAGLHPFLVERLSLGR